MGTALWIVVIVAALLVAVGILVFKNRDKIEKKEDELKAKKDELIKQAKETVIDKIKEV